MPTWLDNLLEPSAKAIVKRVQALESQFTLLSDTELKEAAALLRKRAADGEQLLALMPEAFAAVREASRRTIGLRHFDVQIAGGAELARGRIVEMKTGEGKTLVATLPATLHALYGKGVHVVTVNDYLAARDADWMGPVYRMLGLSVGCIQENMADSERRNAYAADITYGTNHELVFDHLRDNLAYSNDDIVHRGFHFALVDEVDLLLIDEAQTPLIISGQGEADTGLFAKTTRIVRNLEEDIHYKADRKRRAAGLTELGFSQVEEVLGIGSLSHPDNISWMHAVHQSLQAHAIFQKDVDYIVTDGEIFIVDEHTGRVSEDKRFSDGLHQALEAKEGVPVKTDDVTLAKTSYQYFFLGYSHLAGMTGTAWSEREEFRKVYRRKVVTLPTHKPMIRKDYERVIFRTITEKHAAVVEEVVECHERKQPILVGTVSVQESETISRLLSKRGIAHEVLNAKHHMREAAIVAQAGREGAVTISTNMAGRGTDIQLGGSPEQLAEEEADPGSEAYESVLVHLRKSCEEERERIVAAGGLHILGTGEHESVRIDNQLRGRAGRQGDPGSSILFVSLDDTVYKRFGSENILPTLQASLSDHPEGVPITDAHVDRTLTSLRKKVDIENQAIRLDVFKYDAVIHDRREAIWRWRRELLASADPAEWQERVSDTFDELISELEETSPQPDDFERGDSRDRVRYSGIGTIIIGKAELPEAVDSALDGDQLHDALMGLYEERLGLGFDGQLARWEQRILLDIIDRLWTQYLTDLERVEEGIGLRGYAQLDPLVEFRKEAGMLFRQLMQDIRLHAARIWLSVDVESIREARREQEQRAKHPLLNRASVSSKKPKRDRAVDRLPKIRGSKKRKRKN